jgi:hypothetical protein
MTLRRRGYLLEAAKGIRDLPKGWSVSKGYHGAAVIFQLLDEEGREVGFIRVLQMPTCGNAWVITNTRAKKGWGPFLFEVALEHAGKRGLLPDRHEVSDSALRVWQFFYKNRKEIDRFDLTNYPEYQKCRLWNDWGGPRESLDFLLVKRSQKIIPALRKSGQWVSQAHP